MNDYALKILTETLFYSVAGVYNEATTLTVNMADDSPMMHKLCLEVSNVVGSQLWKFKGMEQVLNHAYPAIRKAVEPVVTSAQLRRPAIKLIDFTENGEPYSNAVENDLADEYLITGYNWVNDVIEIYTLDPTLTLLKTELGKSVHGNVTDYIKRLMYGACIIMNSDMKAKVSFFYSDHEQYINAINEYEGTTIRHLLDKALNHLPAIIDRLYNDALATKRLYTDALSKLMGGDLPANHESIYQRVIDGNMRNGIHVKDTESELIDAVSHITNLYKTILDPNSKLNKKIGEDMSTVVQSLRDIGEKYDRLPVKNLFDATSERNVLSQMFMDNDWHDHYLNRLVIRYNKACDENGGRPNDYSLKQFAVELIILKDSPDILDKFVTDYGRLYLSDVTAVHEWYYGEALMGFLVKVEGYVSLRVELRCQLETVGSDKYQVVGRGKHFGSTDLPHTNE